jgi:hypothetical protein
VKKISPQNEICINNQQLMDAGHYSEANDKNANPKKFINKSLAELNSETHYGQAGGLKVQKAPTGRLYTNEVLTP